MRISRLLLCLLFFAGSASATTLETVVLDVRNMTCAVCPITVKKSLEKVPGVTQAKVNYDLKTATVKFDSDKASTGALVKATTEAGFPSSVHKK